MTVYQIIERDAEVTPSGKHLAVVTANIAGASDATGSVIVKSLFFPAIRQNISQNIGALLREHMSKDDGLSRKMTKHKKMLDNNIFLYIFEAVSE